jgi:hypothetical protein
VGAVFNRDYVNHQLEAEDIDEVLERSWGGLRTYTQNPLTAAGQGGMTIGRGE